MALVALERELVESVADAIRVESREVNGYGAVNVEILEEAGVEYVRHPLSECWPALTGEEFIELVESIDNVGLQQMPVTYEGMVLDGWQRCKALWVLGKLGAHAGLFEELPAGGNPEGLVNAQNAFRRQLTPVRRAIAIFDTAQLAGVLAKRGGQVKGGKQVTVKELAARVGVGMRTFGRIKKLHEVDPELLEEVRAGRVSLRAALVQSGIEKDGPVADAGECVDGGLVEVEGVVDGGLVEVEGVVDGGLVEVEGVVDGGLVEVEGVVDGGLVEVEGVVDGGLVEVEGVVDVTLPRPEPESPEPAGPPSYIFALTAISQAHEAIEHLVESITDIFNATPDGPALELLREATRKANGLPDVLDDISSELAAASESEELAA